MKSHNYSKFNEKIKILKEKILSYHDKKTLKEEFINYDYLEYISLKYTSKCFTEICKTLDVDSLDTIIKNF